MSYLDICTVSVISAVLGVTLGATGAYYIVKKTMNREFLLDLFDDFTSDVLQDEAMQKKIYVIGALIGNGIKSGVGLNPKGGKMKLEDLIIGAASQFLGGGGGQGLLGNLFSGGDNPAPQKKQQEDANLVGVVH